MKCSQTLLPGVLLLEPQVFDDERGWPLHGEPILSHKDRAGMPLCDAEVFP